MMHTICKYLVPELLPLVKNWNDVPTRLEELECGAYHRIITLSFMVLMHFGTRQLILSVDDNNIQSVSTVKKIDELCEEIPANHTQHTTLNSIGEESGPEDGVDSQQLPGDAVEVSEEEALRLYQGAKLRQRAAR
jgi:hypothetical protein